jgi:hypothetical protein
MIIAYRNFKRNLHSVTVKEKTIVATDAKRTIIVSAFFAIICFPTVVCAGTVSFNIHARHDRY